MATNQAALSGTADAPLLPMAAFRRGTGPHQIVASKREGGAWPVPLTRRDLYRG
ncbi:MAG: hypothetical protein HZC37_01475 [Burkholderiales bacterium]|nr:hypothetical protein [Burkholderiales bacterium]